MTRLGALLLPALVVAAFVMFIFTSITTPGAAQASTYRFWNFWTVDSDAWVYSQLGPASTFPEDGSVQGWVFAATDADSPSIPPDIAPDEAFDRACAEIPASSGQKRVAIVLDSGTIDIAPTGQVPPTLEVVCAIGSVDASGYELLNSVAQLRTENGFVCAINGYPAMECSAEFTPGEVGIANSENSGSENSSSENSNSENNVAIETDSSATESNALAPIGTALVVGLAAVAGFYFWRRRSS